MSIRTARFTVQDATKVLLSKWSEVRSSWDDAAARAFEEKYIEPIEPAVRAGLAAMEQLEEQVGRAKREAS